MDKIVERIYFSIFLCLEEAAQFSGRVGKIPWRRKWQPTPEFLPGESQGQRSLVGCHLWGRTESDTTEATAAAAE